MRKLTGNTRFLFAGEMDRRREFYADKPDAVPKSEEDAGVSSPTMNYFRPTDPISMSLEYDDG